MKSWEYDLHLCALITSSQSLPDRIFQMVLRAQKVVVYVSPAHVHEKPDQFRCYQS